jgi:hypothetical protein
MAHKTLVVALFGNEAMADDAAARLKTTGLTTGESVGVLALDADGQLKVDKVGARSIGKGAGIGAVLSLLGPVGIGVAAVGGAAIGALHHKDLGLSDEERDAIAAELQNGKAAVGVMAPATDAFAISTALGEFGGNVDSFDMAAEGLADG